ncbi:Zinc finger protein JAGGED [Senna tora]|uniref:Zinc finger protein JAGGED n=1 Tax=Senna tora TaxID=362788 RepID=A0A834W536_9FABA|nr:Zinc finger protein JAGGED [Senna tora]
MHYSILNSRLFAMPMCRILVKDSNTTTSTTTCETLSQGCTNHGIVKVVVNILVLLGATTQDMTHLVKRLALAMAVHVSPKSLRLADFVGTKSALVHLIPTLLFPILLFCALCNNSS